MSEVRLGVLALQGAFREHISMLERLNVEAEEVRLSMQLERPGRPDHSRR